MVGRCYTSPLKSILGSGSFSLVCLICLAGFLRTLSPSGPFTSDSVFWPKTNFKVAIIKTKSATIAFFFRSVPFLLLAPAFSPFLFLRYCDFGASRA